MPRSGGLTMAQAKERAIDMFRKGASVEQAMKAVDRSVKSHENWRAADAEYRAAVDHARELVKSAKDRGVDAGDRSLSFAAWRKEFLDFDTYEHQQQWIDVLEGKEPIPLSGCDWDKRNPNRVIVNVPPFHAKSQTITVDYVTYKICMNPDVRIIIISKRQEQARKFLYQIKQRLTSTRFAKLQAAYAPEGGWKPASGEGTFAQNTIYVAGRQSDAKDPTVEALGMGGQIYGSRADLIVMDDCIVGSNAREYEKQITWMESEVENRLFGGRLLVVGTRLASVDLYSVLREDDRYLSGKSPWSYLRQPMVRSFAEDPAEWDTLWPFTSTPADEGHEPNADGMYTMWDGPSCARIRDSKPAAVWSLVYQQSQVAEDATFNPACVAGSVDGRRKPGPLIAGAWGHPRHGAEGLHVIGSIDPAATGDAFALIYAVDRTTTKRYVLDAWVKNHTPVSWYLELMKVQTPVYGVTEWVIEQNAYANWLIYDDRVTQWAANSGVRITPHFTSRNKQDPDMGVASMAGLFGTLERINEGAGRPVFKKDNLISLPDQSRSEGIKALMEQLVAWTPGTRGKDLKMDGPMCLWFAELRARDVIRPGGAGRQQNYVSNSFLSRGAQRQRYTARPEHFIDA